LLPCECLLPVRGLDISSVGEHGSESSARVKDNAGYSILLINKPKASSFEQLFIHSWMHKLLISVDASPLHYIVFVGSGNGRPRSLQEINDEGARLFEVWGGTTRVNQALP
jgi:hypothetical protein